jgi:putative membrane protein
VSNTVQAPCAFAVERTYAAWVRTGLLAMASGIGAKALLAELLPQWLIIATGSVLVFFSAFCFGAAVWRHLDPGVPPPRADVFRIPPWILIAVNGFLALVALAALLGIWFGRTLRMIGATLGIGKASALLPGRRAPAQARFELS